MADRASFLSRWWRRQHGRQFAITAITSGASAVLLLVSAYQLMFLQDHVDWGSFTGGAIVMLVASMVVLLVAFPEFLRFRGHVVTLDELMAIQSTSELRRRMAEGVASAEALGAGHEARWKAFLDSRGLRR